MEGGTPGSWAPAASTGPSPAPGSLGIRERRSWRTWQLLVMALVMFVVGLYIESLSHVKPVAAASGSFKLPPNTVPGSTGATTTTTTASGAGSSQSTTTTTAPGGASSGVTSTTAAGASGQVAVVLVPRYPTGTGGVSGSWTSPSFTVTSAPWNIGWAYACTGANPSFTVTVGPGTTSAVNETSATGQGVTPQFTTGSFTITATGSAGCQWAVKVTGIGTPAS